jgi:hypothetical protein
MEFELLRRLTTDIRQEVDAVSREPLAREEIEAAHRENASPDSPQEMTGLFSAISSFRCNVDLVLLST